MTAKLPSDQEIQTYRVKVLAKHGVDLPDSFAREHLAFLFQIDADYRALQAELESLRDAFDDIKKTRTRRGKSEVGV
jgi:hypothetical protein